MSLSILNKIGADFKAVFSFLGSSKGQAIIQTGETVAVSLGAPAALINVANNWLTEIIKAETLATAAGSQTGTGTQKAAAVLSAITPQVLAFAQAQGVSAPTADQIATANTALVSFLNAFTMTPTVTPGIAASVQYNATPASQITNIAK
jgi:hypothetical protein